MQAESKQQMNHLTYGQSAFGTTGNIPSSAYRVSPAANRLQRNIQGDGFQEYIDYNSLNALPNPRYKNALGQPTNNQLSGEQAQGGTDSSIDLIMHRMADMMQNQFGLKPKNQSYMYRSPYPEWYNRVALHPRVKPPTDLTKFSGQDDTSTVEHISRYLIQLGEAGTEDAWKIRYFPLSLTGPAFTWFTSLPPHSIDTWAELEQKFHSYFFIGTNEKKLVDLMSLRQKANETPMEYLRRFREIKNMCYSLNLPDDQLPGMAIAGMHPAVREKLFGMEFEDLGQLSHRLATMSNQAQSFKRDNRFQKSTAAVDMYQQFLEQAEEFEDEEEIAAAELMWAKEPTQVSQRWLKQSKGTYDFDVTKLDKIFELLVKEGRVKLPEGHPMLRAEGVKEKRYCGFHNTNSHSINECRVFRMRIQKAIQEGHLKFNGKMKIDGEPFPQNLIDFSVNMVSVSDPKGKGKIQVLTSARAKESGSVDPSRQITERELQQRTQFPNSRTEGGETSRPRVTSRILLNKWQRQQQKEYHQRQKFAEEYRRYEEEMHYQEEAEYMMEQEQSHWGCSFFRHCWNEGLRLPSRNNCPECSNQYYEYRQSRVNRRSIHERLGVQIPEYDRRIKLNDSEEWRSKRIADENWVDYDGDDEDYREYVWQRGQWCPPGLRVRREGYNV